MNKLLIFIFSLLMTSSIHAKLDHVEEGMRLIEEQAIFFNREMYFNIFGYGGSFHSGTINQLELTIEIGLQSDLNTSKYLFMCCLLDWEHRINQDERAAKFLRHCPFEINDLQLRIIFGDYDTASTKNSPKVAFVFNSGKKIVFCYRDQDSNMLVPFHRENFDTLLNQLLENKIDHQL